MQQPLHIALFSKALPSDAPGGVANQVHWLANELVARGHRVTCFTLSPAHPDARYHTHTLPRRSRGRIRAKFEPAQLFAAVNTEQFDIVHYHGDDYLCAGSRRRVRTFYGSALFEAVHARSLPRMAYQSLFYLFELISTARRGCSTAISHATLAALPLVQRVCNCGVPAYFCTGGSPSEHPSILFVGDLHSRKRGMLLVNTFITEILPRLPHSILTIIGPQAYSHPGIRCLNALSSAELIAEYQSAWLTCSPSSYEGFGVPLIESMACGTPVVACRNGGSLEIIRDGANGLLCTPLTLGATLLKGLTDKMLRRRLRQGGLRSVKEYRMEVVAECYERIYRQCSQGSSKGAGV
jgi:glycosyltransferase involved in cell wall biosynthesis